MTLGQRLWRARLERGLDINYAAKLGIAASTLRAYESGDRVPTSEIIGALARALRVDRRYFVRKDYPLRRGEG